MNYYFCVYLEKARRVDMYVSALFGDFSRSYIQKMIDKGQLKVNGKQIKKNVKVQPRDEIEIAILKESLSIEAEEMDLDIIYENSDILVINKDAGINVHPVPGEGGKSGTLVNAVLYHCKDKLPCINGVERPGIVHRLDKDTSGIILVAKTDRMMGYLSEIISQRKIEKYYIAIVNGVVKEKEFKIESYIGRDPNNRKKMTSIHPVNPKIAITYGEVIDYIDNKYSIVSVKIETGRTHQIRVHMASIGHFVLGDNVYGNSKINRELKTKYGLRRQALHAYKLQFDMYGKPVKFVGELKEDMKKIIGDKI